MFKTKATLRLLTRDTSQDAGLRLVGTHGQALSTAVCQDGMLGCPTQGLDGPERGLICERFEDGSTGDDAPGAPPPCGVTAHPDAGPPDGITQ